MIVDYTTGSNRRHTQAYAEASFPTELLPPFKALQICVWETEQARTDYPANPLEIKQYTVDTSVLEGVDLDDPYAIAVHLGYIIPVEV